MAGKPRIVTAVMPAWTIGPKAKRLRLRFRAGPEGTEVQIFELAVFFSVIPGFLQTLNDLGADAFVRPDFVLAFLRIGDTRGATRGAACAFETAVAEAAAALDGGSR